MSSLRLGYRETRFRCSFVSTKRQLGLPCCAYGRLGDSSHLFLFIEIIFASLILSKSINKINFILNVPHINTYQYIYLIFI